MSSKDSGSIARNLPAWYSWGPLFCLRTSRYFYR